jgi:hypothetical protein
MGNEGGQRVAVFDRLHLNWHYKQSLRVHNALLLAVVLLVAIITRTPQAAALSAGAPNVPNVPQRRSNKQQFSPQEPKPKPKQSSANKSKQPYDVNNTNTHTFVLLGGTGRIGTAVASHLLYQNRNSQQQEQQGQQQGKSCHIILVGRRTCAGKEAVRQVLQEHQQHKQKQEQQHDSSSGDKSKSRRPPDSQETPAVSFVQVNDIWDQHDPILQEVLLTADAVIHTAGPYGDRTPTALQATIQAGCKVYIDVADPLAYLETAVLLMSEQAAAAGTTALLSAGAFPGMSNVLAVEAASRIPAKHKVQDVRFQYFTAGLGGSGPLNLFITNIGFGEPMVQFHKGALRFYTGLSGLLLGYVDFFIDTETDLPDTAFGNQEVRQRVGRQKVFAWPFPEAATVSKQLRIRGNSLAAMGTAPAVWNDMLGLLVKVVPRPWWRNHKFSQFLADFSEPLVKATDWFLQVVSELTHTGGSGETHAMRVDVTSRDGPRDGPSVTVIQAHDSFRRCVAQSCAEFALDCLAHPDPGVWLPETRYQDAVPRARIIGQLTSTPGTFCYTGPIQVDAARSQPPTDLEQALQEAEAAERYPYGQ